MIELLFTKLGLPLAKLLLQEWLGKAVLQR